MMNGLAGADTPSASQTSRRERLAMSSRMRGIFPELLVKEIVQ